MALLLASTDFWEDMDVWSKGLRLAMPELDIRVYPDDGDVNEVEFAVVWKHPRGILKKYPNLKAILSLGAGVDHIISDPDLPKGLPIVRLVDKKLTHEMCLHALHWVLHFIVINTFIEFNNLELSGPKKARSRLKTEQLELWG